MDNSAVFQLMLDKAIGTEPSGFVGFDRTNNVQDQLQEMISKYWNLNYTNRLVSEFSIWIAETKIATYSNPSMEQLWLLFVMKKKYNKAWNGEVWTKPEDYSMR